MGVILVLHGECSKGMSPCPPCEAPVPGTENPDLRTMALKTNTTGDKSQASSLFYSPDMLISNGKLKIMPTALKIRR